jgi:hypothetical protein
MVQMKAVRFSARSIPFVVALITIVAYGLLLPLTGFYWDDWPFAWIAHFLGPAEFIVAFQGFRPFLGPIFFLTSSLLPANPILWQILALATRFGATMAAWFALDQVWPRAPRLTLAATLLFLVFPGYSQHWVAFTHINQEWISLIAYLLSFGLSVRAMRESSGAITSTAAAIALQCIGLLPTEYFIGLELLRFIFLWVAISESVRGFDLRLRTSLKAWLPYLFLWFANAVWLAHYYTSGTYVSYDLVAGSTLLAPAEIVLQLGDALAKMGVYVWLQVLPLALGSLSTPSSLATFAIIGTAFPLLLFYFQQLRLDSSNVSSAGDNDCAQAETPDQGAHVAIAGYAMVAGALGILVGRVPSIAAGLPLTLQSSFDRLTISMMLGASLFMAGLLELLMPRPRLRTCLLAGVLALGIGQQFFNANIFRRDWQRQQEIYWQFAWRIPFLQPDTAILVQQMPLDYETDLSMTAAVNWMFATAVDPPHLPYAIVYTEKRLGGDVLPELQPAVPIRLPFRTMDFTGNTSQAIVVYVPSNGCLRVFDPAFDDDVTYSHLPESITAAIPLSDPGRILAEALPSGLPSPPFDREPNHDWCYFYEKAELQRQDRDWGSIVALHAQAASNGYEAGDPFEWLPFIEAEARAGDASWAMQMTRKVLEREPKMQRGLCALWRRVLSTSSNDLQAYGANTLADMQCNQ